MPTPKRAMPEFNIRTVNSRFVTDTPVIEVKSAEEAQAVGVRGAIAIAADELEAGAAVATATVMVSDGDMVLSHVAVTVSVAQLTIS